MSVLTCVLDATPSPTPNPSASDDIAASLDILRASLYSSFTSVVPQYIPEAPALDIHWPLTVVPSFERSSLLTQTQLWQPLPLKASHLLSAGSSSHAQTAAPPAAPPVTPLQAPLPQKTKGVQQLLTSMVVQTMSRVMVRSDGFIVNVKA